MRSMKDSGIPWIGDIPVNWSVNKIKYNLHREEPRNPGNMPVLSLYREYGVIPKDSRDDNHNVTSEDTSKYKHVRVGDFVINKMKAWQGSVAVSRYEGIVSPAYFVYRFDNQNVRREYFNYLIRACYKDEFRRLSGGIREGQWDLPSEALDNTPILLPPIDEQRHIADFLDKKCAEIDSLTADVQKEIEILKEYRRSLITEAVTKGLNPDVEMKDSGIPWIGDIPSHYIPTRIKFLGKYRNGLTYSPKDECDSNEGTLVLRSTNIQDGRIVLDDNVYVNCPIDSRIMIKDGDILICARNGSAKLVGKSAIIENLHATFGAFMMILRTTAVPKYMYYFLNSTILDAYRSFFSTTTVNQLTAEVLGNLVVPYCPDKNEQRIIVDYLDDKCTEIDSIIETKQKQLETLAEYRKSLIYEYVTGKKEVV